jgi:peroxisomal 3,2-trans-enoyl-CoA isomerase
MSSPPASLSPTSAPIALSFPSSHIALITLNNPSKLNSLKSSDVGHLVDALEWVASQPDETIPICVLTGKGRFFSAGADVHDPSRQPPPEAASDPRLLKDFYTQRLALSNARLARVLSTFPKVLVGAMNGPAVGISAAVLGHCDLLYTLQDFWLQVPFTQLGLVCEGLTSTTFIQRMGHGRGVECLLEGGRVPAAELERSGFITRILAPPPTASKDQDGTPPILGAVLERLEQRLSPPSIDPFALAYSKRLIQKATYEGLSSEEANQAELRGAEIVFTSGKPAERVSECGRLGPNDAELTRSPIMLFYQFAAIAGGKRHKL